MEELTSLEGERVHVFQGEFGVFVFSRWVLTQESGSKKYLGPPRVPSLFYLKNLDSDKIVKLLIFSFFTSNFKRTYLLNDKLLEKTDFTIIFKI
jgi:hypothetical protein